MATGKWQGGAQQEPCAEQGHAVPQPSPLPVRVSQLVAGRKLQPPKHLHRRPAPQQASTNKSNGAMNICDFLGACIVTTKILKASQLPCQHPTRCWCLARSSSVGPYACASPNACSQWDPDLWLGLKLQYCFATAGSSQAMKAEQRSKISTAQNHYSKMT